MADKTIVVRVRADTGQYTAQMAAAGQNTVRFGNQVGTATSTAATKLASFSKFAATFGKVVTLGVAGGLALSAKAAIDFESSFTGVQKTLNASEAEFARLRNEIRDLSKEIPINVNALNSIAEIGGQLGISVSGITDFTETIAKLGVTTVLSTDEAALGLARLANILGVSESQFENVGSSLVDLGNSFAATEDQILNFALRIAPIGQTVGLTVDQVLALGTAFASVGVPAERGGTAVQRAFIAMAEAVANGSSELDTFAKTAGRSTEGFVTSFERDAARAFDSFLRGLNDINESGGNVFAVLDDVGLGSQRTVQSLLALSSAGRLLTSTLDQSRRAFDQNNALQAEADLRFETTASKIELAKNQLVDLAISIGTVVLPVVGDLAEGLGDIGSAFANLSPFAKQTIGLLLGTVAGMTIASRTAKLLARSSSSLAASLEYAGAAAGFLRVALGGIVVGGLLLGAKALTDYGRRAEESKARIADLVQVLEDQRKGIEGVTDATLTATIREALSIEDLEAFNRFGISLDTFTEAAKGSAEALGVIEEKLAAGRTQADFTRDAYGNIITSTGELIQGHEETSAAIDASNQTLEAAARITELLTGRTEEFGQALRDQAALIEQEGIAEQVRLFGDNYRELTALDRSFLTNLAAGFEDAGGSAEDAADNLEDFLDELDKINDSIDAGFGLLDAFQNLADVMVELEKEADPSLDQLLNYSKAIDDVRRAAAEAGPEGLAPLISMLEAQRAAGFFTEEQFVSLLQTLLTIEPVANLFGSSSNLLVGNLGAVQDAMANTEVAGQDLIGILIAVDAGLRGFVLNASQAVAVVSAVRSNIDFGFLGKNVDEQELDKITGGLPVAVIERMRDQFASLYDRMVDIGATVRSAIKEGIGGGGGGSIADELEDEVQNAIDRIREKVDTVVSAVEAQLSSEQALRDLQSEEKNLLKLRREQKRLPDEILEAEQRLARARRRAARVTLDEQLAIEQAEETLARAKLAFEQGNISQTELDIAERDLRRARRDSTRENSDAVQEARDRLRELKEREKEIAEEIRDAELAVLDAKLAVLEAQQDLIQAAEEFNDLGRAGKRIFRDMAKEAGFTVEEIREILDIARESQDVLADLGLGGSTPGTGTTPGTGEGGGNREYIVQSGDTLGKIAQTLGVTLTRLIELNATVTNSATGKSRSLDPNLLFAGDILKYHRGGIVPGNQYDERLALLQGGEWVVNPRNGGNIGGVTIENLHIRGVWDFTNPAQVRTLVGRLEQEIESNRRSRGINSLASA